MIPHNKSNTKEFIAKAKKIHGSSYHYDRVEYVNSTTDVEIGCKKHGYFPQRPAQHLQGHGCSECSIRKNGELSRKTIEEARNLPVVITNKGKILSSFVENEKGFFICKCSVKTHPTWKFRYHELATGRWCKQCFYEERRNRTAHIRLNKIETQIVEGTILGDASLSKAHDAFNYHLKIKHSDAQFEYLDWFYKKLQKLNPYFGKIEKYKNSPININGTQKKKFKKWIISKALHTMSCVVLTELEKKWYSKDRVKYIPEDFRLTNLSAAIWFLDDGCNEGSSKTYRWNQLYFATDCFIENDIDRLVTMLINLGYVDTEKFLHRKKWRIRIKGKSYRKFLKMVGRVIFPFPKCFNYKIDISGCPPLKHQVFGETGLRYVILDKKAVKNKYNIRMTYNHSTSIHISSTNNYLVAKFISNQLQQMKQNNATRQDYLDYRAELAIMK